MPCRWLTAAEGMRRQCQSARRIVLEPGLLGLGDQGPLHEPIESPEPFRRSSATGNGANDRSRPAQHCQVVRARQKRHLDRAIGQRPHQHLHRQAIAGDAVDFVSSIRTYRLGARSGHGQVRSPRLGQRSEQIVIDRSSVDRDAKSPEVVQTLRIPRKPRASSPPATGSRFDSVVDNGSRARPYTT